MKYIGWNSYPIRQSPCLALTTRCRQSWGPHPPRPSPHPLFPSPRRARKAEKSLFISARSRVCGFFPRSACARKSAQLRTGASLRGTTRAAGGTKKGGKRQWSPSTTGRYPRDNEIHEEFIDAKGFMVPVVTLSCETPQEVLEESACLCNCILHLTMYVII